MKWSKRPRAILLDLDGTLVDSMQDLAWACNATRAAFGLSARSEQALAAMVGDGARSLVARAFDLDDGDARVDERLDRFAAIYAEHACVHTRPCVGAQALLQRCRADEIAVAVVTNKPRVPARTILDTLAMADAVAFLYAGGDGPLKPDPTGLERALDALGVDAADAAFVGDGPQDVAAGRAAGVRTVGVYGIASRERLEGAGPDELVASLDEITASLAVLICPPAS